MAVAERVDVGNLQWGVIDESEYDRWVASEYDRWVASEYDRWVASEYDRWVASEYDRWVAETKQNTIEQMTYEQEQTDKLKEDSEMRRYIDIGVKAGYDF